MMSIVGDFNDLVIDIEAKLLRNRGDIDLLIRECFLLWYIQIEGIHCESFEESDLKEMLLRNIRTYQELYQDDCDYSFIVGWMASIAFWYFDPLIEEKNACLLLRKAYEGNRNNSLFKWAMRSELKLRQDEVENLKTDIVLRYDQFYSHGETIKSYFFDVIYGSQLNS